MFLCMSLRNCEGTTASQLRAGLCVGPAVLKLPLVALTTVFDLRVHLRVHAANRFLPEKTNFAVQSWANCATSPATRCKSNATERCFTCQIFSFLKVFCLKLIMTQALLLCQMQVDSAYGPIRPRAQLDPRGKGSASDNLT